MTIPSRIREFLNGRQVAYEVIPHAKRDTALATAEVEHVPGDEMLKAVMVKVKGKDAMVVVPADRVVDLFKLSAAMRTKDVSVDEERDFDELFPDCERGAMPPFGALYGLPCYVDATVEKKREVYFNAGTHRETIRMGLNDYLVLAEAEIGDYSVPRRKAR
jgi:Ala-tRNA(Pro) deacylase